MIAYYNGWYIQPCNLQLLHKKPFRLLFLSQGESEHLRIIFFSRPSLKRSQQSALSRNSTLIKFVFSTCTYYNHFLTWHRQREEESEKIKSIIFSNLCSRWITIIPRKIFFSWNKILKEIPAKQQKFGTKFTNCINFLHKIHKFSAPNAASEKMGNVDTSGMFKPTLLNLSSKLKIYSVAPNFSNKSVAILYSESKLIKHWLQ